MRFANSRTWLLLLTMASVGCSRSRPTGPIFLGHLADSKFMAEEYAGVLESTFRINSEKDQLPLGQHVGLVFGDLGKVREQRIAQVFRVSTVDQVPVIIGGIHSSVASHINLAIHSEKMVGIVTAGHPSGGDVNSAVFCIGISPKSQGTALATFAQKQGWEAIAILHASEYPSPTLAWFKESASRLPLRLSQWPMAKGTDFAAMAKRLASVKPSAILAIGTAEEVDQWRGSLPEVAPLPWIFGGEECELHQFSSREDSKYPLWAACSCAQRNHETPAYRTMRDHFHARHDRDPTLPSILGWEAVQIAVEAIRRADSIDPEKIREQLTKADAVFPVLTGELRFHPDRTAIRPIQIVRVTEAGLVLVQTDP